MTAVRVVESDPFVEPHSFEALCSASDAINEWVYVSSDSINGVPQVRKAIISSDSKMPCVGIITQKFSATSCLVVYYGLVTLSGLQPGVTYFVGADSLATASRPTGPALVQIVGVAIDSTRLLVNPMYNMTKVI